MAKHLIQIFILALVIIGALFGYSKENLKEIFSPLPPKTLINVSGTGSMYPTIPKGTSADEVALSNELVASIPMYPYTATPSTRLFDKTIHTLTRGDIIRFENDITRQITTARYNSPTGLVKRVIGLPGDQVEIKNGLVYINSTPLEEPYTAQAHSTFGGDSIPECTPVNIPSNAILALGDNRKGSGDSRHELGLVPLSDINYVLPWKLQEKTLTKNFRDTTNDFSDSSKIKLDSQELLTKINSLREQNKLKPLKLQPKLSQAALIQLEAMFKHNDLSYEATRSGVNQRIAMNKANYSNIIWSQWLWQGYYDAQEIYESLSEYSNQKTFFLNREYQDLGIATLEGTLYGCPTQLILFNIAGYRPPNYSKEVIDSWVSLIEGLKNIKPGWSSLKDNASFYSAHKLEIDRINEIIDIRIQKTQSVVSSMQKNIWLTSQQQYFIDHEEQKLYEEQKTLANKLNSY